MSGTFRIRHKSTFKYEGTVKRCYNLAFLKPVSNHWQKLIQFNFETEPKNQWYDEHVDAFGNTVIHFQLRSEHKQLVIISDAIVKTNDIAKAQTSLDPISSMQFKYSSEKVPTDEMFSVLVAGRWNKNDSIEKLGMIVSKFVNNYLEYVPGSIKSESLPSELIHSRKGNHRDFSQLSISIIRSLGVPAAYVSGYLETLPSSGGEKLNEKDASHAWFSIFCEKNGWLDFDPTNAKARDSRYIEIARGRDYNDVSPIKPVSLGGGNHTATVEVEISPVHS